jgi:RNA polymerase sigma-70 factor
MVERQLSAELVGRLHRKADAERWGVTPDRFASSLAASAAHAPAGESGADLERYLGSLHVEDLALAAACADGHEAAWDFFVREHRPVLYRAADAIDATGAAREAADELYAELFGLKEQSGERRSLFRYFHGRSTLATWLRAVLAQRYVDNLRRTRRFEPFGVDEDAARTLPGHAEAITTERAHFLEVVRRALMAAVDHLAPRDRLRLACYHAQGLTLAQIGRLLREHEATTSRHLTRTRRAIREDVERQLRNAEGMSEVEVAECLASVMDDAGTLDLAEILPAPRKNPAPDRST